MVAASAFIHGVSVGLRAIAVIVYGHQSGNAAEMRALPRATRHRRIAIAEMFRRMPFGSLTSMQEIKYKAILVK